MLCVCMCLHIYIYIQIRENDNRRHQLHNLMMLTEQKMEEAELRRARALDRTSLAHKLALEAYDKQKALEEEMELKKKSVEYDDLKKLKEASEFKDYIDYVQEVCV